MNLQKAIWLGVAGFFVLPILFPDLMAVGIAGMLFLIAAATILKAD